MKKVLALIVAFALCITVFAGCFATSAAAVADFAVLGSTVDAAGGAATVTVSGSYTDKTVQLLTVTLPDGVDFAKVDDTYVVGMKELTVDGDEGDYVVNGKVIKFLNVYTGAFSIVINVTAAANATEADVAYTVDASAEIADFDDTEVTVVTASGAVTVKAKAPEHTCAAVNYTNNGDGTHDGVCDCEDATVVIDNEAHSYTDGVCVCGAVEEVVPEGPVVDETLSFKHSLNLASDLSITFKIYTSLMTEYDPDSIYAEVYRDLYTFGDNPVKSTSEVVRIPGVKTGSGSTEAWSFKYSGLAAREMTSKAYCVVYGTKNGVQYCSVVDEYAIQSWCIAASKGNKAKDQALAATLAYYGAQAQNFTNYNKANLASSGEMEQYMSRRTVLDTNTFADNKTTTDNPNGIHADTKWTRALMLTDVLGLKFKVQLTNEYAAKADDLKLVVTYVSKDTKQTVTAELDLVYEGGYYCATYYGLKSYEFDVAVNGAVYDGNTQVTRTYSTSATDWCAAAYKNSKNANEVALADSIVCYNAQAITYFGK